MSSAGVLLANIGLQPSKQGKRYTFKGGRPSVMDGPFAESKELIAGYVIIRAQSLEEASEWALRYGDVVSTPEVDLRVVEETPGGP
jgi:PhnB protein